MGVITQIRRGFDLMCTLAGLAALVLLGPWMLVTAVSRTTPDVHELTSIDGTVGTCRETITVSVIVLAGREAPFESQAGTCADVLATQGHHPRVSIFVVPSSLGRGTAPVPSYGLAVEGKVVRYPQADLQAIHVDRAFRLAVGPIGTLALIWLIVVIARSRGRLRLLLIGDEQSSPERK